MPKKSVAQYLKDQQKSPSKSQSSNESIFTPDPSLLLHPQIPKPMHGMAPRVVLGLNWWNRVRLLCYKSTNFHCEACGVHKTKAKYKQWLEAHEIYNIDYAKGLMTFVRATPLCHYCHNYIHVGRLQWLLEVGKLNQQKFTQIIQHGDAILTKAGLLRRSKIEVAEWERELVKNGQFAPWERWRLVVGGQKYPPKYKSYQEWLENINASTK